MEATKDPDLYLNNVRRDYDVVGEGVYDDFHMQTLQPLQMAKIYLNFTSFPDKLIYNEHIEIKITDEEGEEYRLPYYFSNDNNLLTNK